MILFDKFEHLVDGFIVLWNHETKMPLRVFVKMKLIQTCKNESVVNLPVVFRTRKQVRFTADEGDLEARDFVPFVEWWSILTIVLLVQLHVFVVEFFELVGDHDLSVMV